MRPSGVRIWACSTRHFAHDAQHKGGRQQGAAPRSDGHAARGDARGAPSALDERRGGVHGAKDDIARQQHQEPARAIDRRQKRDGRQRDEQDQGQPHLPGRQIVDVVDQPQQRVRHQQRQHEDELGLNRQLQAANRCSAQQRQQLLDHHQRRERAEQQRDVGSRALGCADRRAHGGDAQQQVGDLGGELKTAESVHCSRWPPAACGGQRAGECKNRTSRTAARGRCGTDRAAGSTAPPAGGPSG